MQYAFGMIGLGTMGHNLLLNISDNGFSIAGYDTNAEKVSMLNEQSTAEHVHCYSQIEAFIAALSTPRIILLLVPAGKIVDSVIETLKPHLSKLDCIIDCGNSHFSDTESRIKQLEGSGIKFMGIGVSGGETGARNGPSIMPGGDKAVYNKIEPMLQAIAAKAHDNKPCTAYMGSGSAGHYVKMVHNGIEYALMQLLAECYHILKLHAGLSNEALHRLFTKWNEGKLQGYLVEITAAIFAQKDDVADNRLIDKIADKAAQKGTGAWMSQDAMNVGAAIPAIDAAVTQRIISSMKSDRIINAALLQNRVNTILDEPEKDQLITAVENALYSAYILCFAQGLQMLQQASEKYGFQTNIPDVVRIWRGGCIIRASLLDDIADNMLAETEINNLMQTKKFNAVLQENIQALREIVQTGIVASIPLPVFSACLLYYNSMHQAWLPANLIQAQRDFFGAHTYERNDMPGNFHTEWNKKIL